MPRQILNTSRQYLLRYGTGTVCYLLILLPNLDGAYRTYAEFQNIRYIEVYELDFISYTSKQGNPCTG
jgi:hypothetical protein